MTTTSTSGSADIEEAAAEVAAARRGRLLVLHTTERPMPEGALVVDFADREPGTVPAADALLGELRRLAVENGWSVVRWITADDNYRGRAKYDQYATRTTWVTYDMAP